jgi:antitoxin ChpS
MQNLLQRSEQTCKSFGELLSNIITEVAVYTTNLRKVGDSVMLAVPPALLDLLQLRPGAKVGIAVENGRLIVDPQTRPRYTLKELLAQCDPKTVQTREEREWLNDKALGDELI